MGASFETAVKQDPGNRDTALILARIYREEPQVSSRGNSCRNGWGAKTKVQPCSRREQKADHVMDNLVAAHPDQPEVRLARYQYRLQYKIPGADDDLKEALRLGPENIDVLLASAGALLREARDNASGATTAKVQSLREAARDKYQKVVTLAPDDFRGYLGLGDTQRDLGRSQEAIDAWKLGLRFAPASAATFDMSLASSLVNSGRFDEAEQPLDQLANTVDAIAATGQDSPEETSLRGTVNCFVPIGCEGRTGSWRRSIRPIPWRAVQA